MKKTQNDRLIRSTDFKWENEQVPLHKPYKKCQSGLANVPDSMQVNTKGKQECDSKKNNVSLGWFDSLWESCFHLFRPKDTESTDLSEVLPEDPEIGSMPQATGPDPSKSPELQRLIQEMTTLLSHIGDMNDEEFRDVEAAYWAAQKNARDTHDEGARLALANLEQTKLDLHRCMDDEKVHLKKMDTVYEQARISGYFEKGVGVFSAGALAFSALGAGKSKPLAMVAAAATVLLTIDALSGDHGKKAVAKGVDYLIEKAGKEGPDEREDKIFAGINVGSQLVQIAAMLAVSWAQGGANGFQSASTLSQGVSTASSAYTSHQKDAWEGEMRIFSNERKDQHRKMTLQTKGLGSLNKKHVQNFVDCRQLLDQMMDLARQIARR